MNKIGIDLGGTKIESILLDDNLEVLARKRIWTPHENYNKIVESIVDLVSEIKSSDTKSEQYTIGVCTPGTISKQTGLIKNSNTQCLIGKPLQQDLEKKLMQKISMENDANCFAMAEAIMGAAKNHNIVFGVILGTGVGGGIVINGKIHQGRTNIAGEWGHTTLSHHHHHRHQNNNLCYCGKQGCVETYISGPALEKRWQELTGLKQSLRDIVLNISGEPALCWKKEFLDNFGMGLANVIDILDPDVIVLGGGVSNIPFLYDQGKESVYKHVFSNFIDTPILQNKLGDSAGVFGASLLNKL